MKLTDEQKKALVAAGQAKQAKDAREQRAREAYADLLTRVEYGLLQANREAHFHPAKDTQPAPLMKPDEIRKAAIELLAEKGVFNPDAPVEAPAPEVPAEESPADEPASNETQTL